MTICDFCSSPAVIKQFDCCDFDSESADAGVIYNHALLGKTNMVFKSVQFWAACEPCAALVEKHDINGLLERALYEQTKHDPSRYPIPYLKAHMRRTYELFFRNRIRVETEK